MLWALSMSDGSGGKFKSDSDRTTDCLEWNGNYAGKSARIWFSSCCWQPDTSLNRILWGCRQTILICGIMSFTGMAELLLLTGLFSGTHFWSVSNRWAKLIDLSRQNERHKFWMRLWFQSRFQNVRHLCSDKAFSFEGQTFTIFFLNDFLYY